MKSLTTIETYQISGGTIITVMDNNISVDTSGIPTLCVKQIVEMANAVGNAVENEDMFTNAVATLGKHMDILDNSGCITYLETFNNKLQTATVI